MLNKYLDEHQFVLSYFTNSIWFGFNFSISLPTPCSGITFCCWFGSQLSRADVFRHCSSMLISVHCIRCPSALLPPLPLPLPLPPPTTLSSFNPFLPPPSPTALPPAIPVSWKKGLVLSTGWCFSVEVVLFSSFVWLGVVNFTSRVWSFSRRVVRWAGSGVECKWWCVVNMRVRKRREVSKEEDVQREEGKGVRREKSETEAMHKSEGGRVFKEGGDGDRGMLKRVMFKTNETRFSGRGEVLKRMRDTRRGEWRSISARGASTRDGSHRGGMHRQRVKKRKGSVQKKEKEVVRKGGDVQ